MPRNCANDRWLDGKPPSVDVHASNERAAVVHFHLDTCQAGKLDTYACRRYVFPQRAMRTPDGTRLWEAL